MKNTVTCLQEQVCPNLLVPLMRFTCKLKELAYSVEALMKYTIIFDILMHVIGRSLKAPVF